MAPLTKLFPLLAAVVLAGGTLQGAAGFGFALLTTVAFLSILNSSHAVTMGSIISFGAALTVIPKVWKYLPRPLVVRIGVGILVGEPIGVAVFFYSSTSLLKLVAGTVVLIFSVILLCKTWLEKSHHVGTSPPKNTPASLLGPIASTTPLSTSSTLSTVTSPSIIGNSTSSGLSLSGGNIPSRRAHAHEDGIHAEDAGMNSLQVEGAASDNAPKSEAARSHFSPRDTEDDNSTAHLAPFRLRPIKTSRVHTKSHFGPAANPSEAATHSEGHDGALVRLESMKTSNAAKLLAEHHELHHPPTVMSRLRASIKDTWGHMFRPICGPPGCRDWFPNWDDPGWVALEQGLEHPAGAQGPAPVVKVEVEQPPKPSVKPRLTRIDTTVVMAAGLEMTSPLHRDRGLRPVLHPQCTICAPPADYTFVKTCVPVDVTVGLITGICGGAVGLSGPPLVLYLTVVLAHAPKNVFRAVCGIVLPGTGVLSVSLQLAVNGLLPRQFWIVCGLLIPVAAIGGILGNWLSSKISPLFFRYLTLGVLVTSSAQLLTLSFFQARLRHPG
eukprot:jgi/Mesvir1/1850/Mv06950-RA.1